MRLFINAVAASAGGGITYIRNVVPQLASRPEVQVCLLVSRNLRQQFLPPPNVRVLKHDLREAGVRRLWSEQVRLPGLIRSTGADVLISTGNFALRNCPVPQILLSRNSLYTSSDFAQDLLRRREYRMWAETRIRGQLAKASVGWADMTVAPSRAFAHDLQRWTGRSVRVIYHGFDRGTFLRGTELPGGIGEKLAAAQDAFKLLFVSHYNYYRNFETLLRGFAILRERMAPRRVKLVLTCKLQAGENPGSYHTAKAAALVKQLRIADDVVQLGTVPYDALATLYKSCDVYVTAAYAETFAHPLVEAMASGLPIVASDLAVHREICGETAAAFFPTFSAEQFADRVTELVRNPEALRHMSTAGVTRSQDFSWERHVSELLEAAETLISVPRQSARGAG